MTHGESASPCLLRNASMDGQMNDSCKDEFDFVERDWHIVSIIGGLVLTLSNPSSNYLISRNRGPRAAESPPAPVHNLVLGS